MAKRQRVSHISASFHSLVKRPRDDDDDAEDLKFTQNDFQKLLNRIGDTSPINFKDDDEVRLIKLGKNIPFLYYEKLEENTHFGCFEGAYYGQEYRNTKVGLIDADSLNLRQFGYILDFRRDGTIVVGTQYTGNFGDYDGLRKCLAHILSGSGYKVISRSFTSFKHEITDGKPVEIKVNIRRQGRREGASSLFSKTATFGIKRSEYGDDFEADVKRTLGNVRGSRDDRKAALAKLLNQGEMIEIDDDDIIGCTVLIQKDKGQHTVYLLGDGYQATKFPLAIDVPPSGIPDRAHVRNEMRRILDDVITPGLRK